MPKKLLCVFMCLALMLPGMASMAEGATTAQALVGRSVAIPVCQGRDAAQVLTSLEITGLDAPVIGEKLDDEAEVISAEGVRWTIPVLWVNGQGQPIDRAAAGINPMPVLLFVMQDSCWAALNINGLVDISLSEYLLQVFKSGIVTLAVEAQKVTYITGLNIDLNRLANPAPEATAKSARVASHDEEDEEEPATVWPEPTVEPTPEPTEAPDYVALYASKTARDAVEAKELARVIDILVNNVQPQAVNLLRDRFPAFHEAAEDGGISTQIGLYVYYQRGDGDTTAHWAAGSAQAAVTSSDVEREDGSVGFGSVVIYNLDGLLSVDAEGKLVADTGSDDWKYMESTVVHEFMHAFMSDYNRVGVLGRNDPAFRNLGEVSEDVEYLANWHFQQLMFPDWFREGTATTVANAYTDLKRHFDILKADAAGDDSPAYSRESILTTYANYWDWYGGEFDIKMGTLRGNYPAGYLAVLYLSERAAAGDEALGSSMRTDADGKAICVDDEATTLEYVVERCRELSQMDLVEGFTEAREALEWLRDNPVDIAFLDIDMPDMDGITLAARIKKIHPNIAIVFLTAYKQFAYDAMSVRPSGYLLKPLTRQALLEEVEYAMMKVQYKPLNQGSGIVVRTFGNFDVYVDGELLTFSRSKSKEVLAFLVNQQGRSVKRSEIYETLWEDEDYGHRQQKYLDVIIRSLRETLKQAGISQILEMKNGLLKVIPETFDCDLYRFIQGDPAAVRAYKGKYMNGYSWAEF